MIWRSRIWLPEMRTGYSSCSRPRYGNDRLARHFWEWIPASTDCEGMRGFERCFSRSDCSCVSSGTGERTRKRQPIRNRANYKLTVVLYQVDITFNVIPGIEHCFAVGRPGAMMRMPETFASG